jgi:hypothetical protein
VLRPDEKFLSVCWLDYFEAQPPSTQLREVKRELSARRVVKDTHRLAPLVSKQARDYVERESGKLIQFIHKPSNGFECHAGIFGIPQDADMLIPELLRDVAQNVIPAT